MKSSLHIRRLLEWSLLAFGVAVSGCVSDQVSSHTEVWKSGTNECYAVYRHEWADAVFVSPTSSVPFTLVVAMAGAPEDEGAKLAQAGDKTSAPKNADNQSTSAVQNASTGVPSGAVPAGGTKTNAAVSTSAGAMIASANKADERGTSAASRTVNRDNRAGSDSKTKSGQTHANAYDTTSRADLGTPGQVASSAIAGQVAHVRAGTAKSQMRVGSGTSVQQFSGATSTVQSAVTDAHQFQSAVESHVAFPLLTIVAKPRTEQVIAGDDIIFDFVLSNDGDLKLRDITLVDPESDDLKFAGVESSTGAPVTAKPGEANGMKHMAFAVSGVLDTGRHVGFSARYHTTRPAPAK